MAGASYRAAGCSAEEKSSSTHSSRFVRSNSDAHPVILAIFESPRPPVHRIGRRLRFVFLNERFQPA